MLLKPDRIKNSVGQNLRRLRVRRGWSRAQFAAMANANSEPTLSISGFDILEIENGRKELCDFYLPLVLAECLGITVDELTSRCSGQSLDRK